MISVLTASAAVLVLVGTWDSGDDGRTESGRTSATILVVGDSLQVGTGPVLERRIGGRVKVFARSGRRSGAALKVLSERFRPTYDSVVFDIGTNDALSGVPAAEFAANLRATRRLTGKRCLILSTINPPSERAFNRVIRRFARRSASVSLFRWRRFTLRRPEVLTDGLHATPEGYRARARQVIRAVRRCRS